MKSEISERYQIISELGTGGMGSVYLVLDKILDKRVAVKVLARKSIADDPKGIQRFRREAMAAGKVAHPIKNSSAASSIEGMKFISDKKTLTGLEFGGGVSGKSFAYILKLKNLYSLDLKVIRDLTPEQLASLSALNLTCLYIHNKNLSSEDLRAISKIRTLEKLNLTAVKVVDSDKTGLEALARMRRLQRIEFHNTEYSLADLKRFHALNPHCKLLEVDYDKKLLPIKLEGAK